LAGGAPAIADPANPTAAELRRLAIYSNYRALVDITAAGGYGILYGPNVLADGTVTANEGVIPGTECLTYADDGSGRKNVTLMVQIPASFDPGHPCIVTGPSSGSRGI
jgi:hydroxybutyrate-dimer hydrolase